MSVTAHLIVWPLIGYLIGSISTAIISAKLFNLSDPRSVGSGNPGATNVLRSGSKLAAIVTLAGDVAKGVIPILLAQHFSAPVAAIALTAIAAFLGHLYPLYYSFKGGKGVATAIGVYLALDWRLAAVFGLAWLLTAAISRYSSLASLIASGVTGLASFAIFNQQSQLQLIGAVFMIVAFTFKRHSENIERLKSGRESKIGSNSDKPNNK